MKIALLFVLVASVVAIAYAKADCGYGASIECVGPVLAVYYDKECDVPKAYNQLYPSDTAHTKTCYQGNGTSWEFSCGRHITRYDYTQSNCEGEKSTWKSVVTGKCFQVGENEYNMYTCASASTISFSIALLAFLALMALFL